MKKKTKRGILVCSLVLMFIVAFALSPLFPYVRSLAVMRVYSAILERESLSEDCGLWVDMPGGGSTREPDWYPFVMTFNADEGFSRYSGRDARLTILYNFGAFDLTTGASRIYDKTSSYYNSFYGAYLVQEAGEAYGFTENGKIDGEELALVPRYDFFRLVLGDFGLREVDGTFEWTMLSEDPGQYIAGEAGWTRLKAELTVSSVSHREEGFVTSYLQYGAPPMNEDEPFAPVDMQAIIYAKYFPEQDVSIFLYALCAGEEALERCEREILAKTTLRKD